MAERKVGERKRRGRGEEEEEERKKRGRGEEEGREGERCQEHGDVRLAAGGEDE